MSITIASPTEHDLEIDEDSFTEEGSDQGTEYNFRELYDEVQKAGDIIITVPADQVTLLKQGLIVRKSKEATKLKNAGLVPDSRVLAFLVYPAQKDGKEIPGLMDVRVKLRNKRSVSVIDMRIPDDL
jgi:sporulation protein YlmC with PRC-barrel domain